MKRKMNLTVTFLAAVAAVTFSVSGATYYVDADKGDDSRDGSSPEIGEGNVGPRKTLVGIMELAKNSGDIVYAAPGRYDDKDDGGYRVKIPSGVTLKASGDKEETFILGEAAPETAEDRDASGNGTGAIRCAYMSADSRLVGFTLTGGRTPAGDKQTGGCVVGNSESEVVIDCVVSNNAAVHRGGAFSYVTHSVRCYFADNKCGNVGQSMLGGSAYNCVFGQSSGYHVQGGKIYNCTFLSTGSNCKNSIVYNSLLLKKDSGNNNIYRCVYVEKAGSSTYNEDCIQISSDAATSFLDGAWRPQKDSAAVNAGNPDYYNNNIPEALSSEKDTAMIGARFIGEAIDIGAVEYGQKINWYVDAENGNDGNKGFPRSRPKKTLAAAMESAYDGDIVYAARGVYNEGEMDANGMTNRVYVKEGVGLVADEGPKVTTIKGKRASTENGIGTDAVRCVSLENNAWIQGFTITNGFTKTTENSTSYGGGVYAEASSAMIDCVLTGNGCGYRGASTYRGTCIRCLFHGASAAGSFSAYRMSGLVNCVFIDGANCYGDSTVSVVLNCLMAGGATYGSKTLLCNSYIKTTQQKSVAGITNCVLGVTEGYINNMPYDPETCKYSVEYDDLKLDENYRPALDSALVDFADKELYDAYFPEAWERFKDVDFSGGQRVYNGRMDVGAGEYDWRATFSTELNRAGRAAVIEASENVMTNASGGISLAGGDSVEVVYSPAANGKCAFSILTAGGDGEVTAKLGDKVLQPDEHGVYYYAGDADGNRITVSCIGDGSVVLSKFAGPIRGLSITLR